MESLIISLLNMTVQQAALCTSLLLHILTFRLWYKYTQLDKIVLLVCDRSHRDLINIERDGNYSIRNPLNRPIPTLQEKV